MCHTPRYFYLDQERTCVQCGKAFVFSAEEQKYWYEILKFYFDSVVIRCPDCRRRRRSEKALRSQIAAARQGLEERPGDPALLIQLAQAVAQYHQHSGQGNLDEAISACRKALESWPDACEALFWEATCQQLAGREMKARDLFASFVERAPRVQRMRPLLREAEGFLGHTAQTPGHEGPD